MQIQTRSIPTIFMIGLLLGCSPFLPLAQAVVPPPDGGYPGGNTAEGQNALLNLTTGVNNTAVGWFSLKSNTNGQLNTAVGAGTLFSAVHASRNTAIGGAALFSDTDGERNTAVGALALWSNTTGDFNTALGDGALFAASGSSNTAVGAGALQHPAGDSNTALGVNAGVDISGSNNIVIGANIFGFGGSNTIVIGANVGMLGESNTIRIGNTDITDTFISGISGTTVASGAAVLVDSSGHLGTVTSSKRFKEEIRPMNKTSEAIFYLEPVTFRYKKEIDPAGTSQFGLIAEEVAAVNPDLVVRDRNGQIYAVRYDQVNAMLLNEFLKEHEKIEEQQATIADLKSTVAQQQSNFESRLAQQKRQIESLTAGLQKVSAQLEVNKTVPQLIAN